MFIVLDIKKKYRKFQTFLLKAFEDREEAISHAFNIIVNHEFNENYQDNFLSDMEFIKLCRHLKNGDMICVLIDPYEEEEGNYIKIIEVDDIKDFSLNMDEIKDNMNSSINFADAIEK